MKRLGISVSLILAVLILAFSVLSVFGCSYYVGDNKNTVIKGFGSIDWGVDVNGGSKIAVKAASVDEIDAVADVVRDRAAGFGLTDHRIVVDEEAGVLELTVPSSLDCDFSAAEVAAFLTAYGEVTLRPGGSYTTMNVDSSDSASFITPSGTTAQSVLITSDDIKGSSWFEYTEEKVTYYYVNLDFDAEGAEKMAAYTNADTGTYYNQTVSIWLDDRMLANPTVSETIDQGALSFSSDSMTQSKCELYSAIISSGTLPCTVSIVSTSEAAPVAGNISDIIFIAGIVALVAIAVIMLIRYKLGAVAGLCAMLLQFSAVLAVITRFAGEGRTFLLTIPGAAALALSVMTTVFSFLLMGERMKSELSRGTVLGTAISTAVEKSRMIIVDMSIVLAVVALMGLFIFGTSGLTVSIFGAYNVSGVYNFSYVLFFGAVFNLVTGYLVPQLMLRSLQSFAKKPSMFGGAK
ncbi:MAG: hypothetical protein IJ298_05125 [Ruminococcus sp.]|nr:hypothetical protein [Ruminococcus sp.]